MPKSRKVKYILTGGLIFVLSWIALLVVYSADRGLAVNKNALIIDGKQYSIDSDLARKFKAHVESDERLGPQPVEKNSNFKKEEDYQKQFQLEIETLNEFKPKIDQEPASQGHIIHKVKAKVMHHIQKGEEEWRQEGLPEKRQDHQPQEQHKDFYTLIQGGLATPVHRKIHETLRALPPDVDENSYIFTTNKLPENPRLYPSIGNGQIATAVWSEKVFMNGVYSGMETSSQRAVIPSTLTQTFHTEDEIKSKAFTMNIAEGTYTERFGATRFNLTRRLYAHRSHPYVLVMEVDLERFDLEPVSIEVKGKQWRASGDITFLETDSGITNVIYKFGSANAPETPAAHLPEVHVLYDEIPPTLTPPSGSTKTKWVFITAIAPNREAAYAAYKNSSKLVLSHDALYTEHVKAWSALWDRGRIEIHDDVEIARATLACQYYILSSIPLVQNPESPFIGFSPSGLSYGDSEDDYQGHVFWDQDTWIYPPVLLLHPDLASLVMGTRIRTLPAALHHAKLHKRKGAQYPWESALTGSDVTPDREVASNELHISADITLAILQYVHATRDLDLLREALYEVVVRIAEFWVSVLKLNHDTGKSEIWGVMPPDEYATCVNNSVYTNTVAKMSLNAVEYLSKLLNHSQVDDRFRHFAESIYIPLDKQKLYHPEYDGYKLGKTVKQADVILLGYPLQRTMPPQVRRNDLELYEKVTNSSGPAMSWSMFSIGWLELGHRDQGDEMFRRNWRHIDKTFQVWSEEPGGKGAANFITGMGGFLQNILAGYAGIRLLPDCIKFNPQLPGKATSVRIIDMNYLGSAVDFIYTAEDILITLRSRQEGAPKLIVYLFKTAAMHSLDVDKTVRFPVEEGAIFDTDSLSAFQLKQQDD